MKEVMATDYIDSKGLYHFIRDYGEIITPDKEYIEQVLGRKFGADFDGDVAGIYGIKEEKEMGNNKIVTLIGSMSETNKAAMIALFNRLTLKGDFVNFPYMDRVSEDVSDDQINTLHSVHEYKMAQADLIIVVDADGHIGKDTQREIKWCSDHSKNLIYLSDMQVYDGEEKQTKGGKK